MEQPTRHDVTQLIAAACDGDPRAAEHLLPLVYEEMRRLAAARLAKEPGAGKAYTLQPTALVHEAYMRLVGGGDVRWDGRGHFFAAAALAMRRILVERARRRGRVRHGGGRQRVALPVESLAEEPQDDELLLLDDALKKLEELDARKYQVVMLRYFAGLSIEDTAAALDISSATVKNDWNFARAWLRREVMQADQ
ncbi:MAG: sigma-70 family RNA polymerase sigma factor [Phycisphaeraceae bacterium]|nr:sigma-70 family RNA polymerase sigma factor [Phycisphaerae bacterium]MBX3392155.1 sigma-70 family RNA polymerase sigma factor [Phycisphaeraceae bacterium]HRJ49497.1 ECF-type sigma factor [Phycisphaerales bacterium]